LPACKTAWLGGVASGAAERYLEDGGYLHVRQAMGLNIITLVAGAEPADKLVNVEYYYPDVLGGLHDGTAFYPNAQTASYSTPEQRNQKLQGVQASGMECLPATHFSGSLKKVVQFCRGYFKHNGDLWEYPRQQPEGTSDNPDRRWPTFWHTPDMAGRFNRSSGLAFASDGTPYLIQVSQQNGVLAGPLPLHPDTCGDNFDRFLDYLVEKGISEIVEVLDWLGGLPTGEGIPDDPQNVQIWLDAGLGKRLLTSTDTAPLLDDLSPFDPYLGMAFNPIGTAAHNTAYKEDDKGRRYAHHYQIEFTAPPSFSALREPKAGYGALLARIGGIIEANGELGRVLLGKIRMLSEVQISDALSMDTALASATKVLNFPIWNAPSYAGLAASLSKVEEGELSMPRELRFPWLGYIHGWPNGVWDAPTTPYFLDFGGQYGGRFVAEFAGNAGSIAPNAKNTQNPHVGAWYYEPDDCDTTFFVYFKGDTLCKVKWKLVNRPTQAPKAADRNRLRNLNVTLPGSPEDHEITACSFGNGAPLTGTTGVDPYLAQHIDYAHEYFQPAWTEAGFYCEEENIEALHAAQDFAFEPDEATRKAEDLGGALMRNGANSKSVFQVKLIRVSQTVYWHAHLPHAQFRAAPAVAREFCTLSKAQQEVRIPMRYHCVHGVVNPHYAYIKTFEDGSTSLEQATRSFTYCEGSHQDGWDWLQNSVPKPFYQNSAGQWRLNTHALGRDYLTTLPDYLTSGQATAWLFHHLTLTHTLAAEVTSSQIILNSGNLGANPTTGLLWFNAGLAFHGEATPDAEQAILDEQGHYWLLGDHTHSSAEHAIDPEANAWYTHFSEGQVAPPALRTILQWAPAWGATWNTLGDNPTLYHMTPLNVLPGYRLEKHGSGSTFPASPESATPQFCGVNP